MFPSSGFFADINCPFSQHGRCERPHCLYKHPTKQARDWFAVSFESSKVDFTEEQRPYTGCGDDCLHELERINKEIESVRHEVEQERMRLSRYQTVQADRINNRPASKREFGSKTVDRKAYGPSSRTDFTKAHQRGKKYVVDNSKPRTDLEYDPLSNFSADLLSFSSLTKDQKLKSRQVKDKSPKNTAPCNDKEPFAYQAPISRSPSPEPLDVSSEGEDLIIDVPPSPDKTGQRTAKSVAGKSSQVTAVEVTEEKKEPNLPDSPSRHYKIPLSSSDSNKTHHYVENSQDLLTILADKESEDLKNGGNVVDLTESPEDLVNECQKITKSVLEKIPEQQDHNLNNPQCDLLSIFEKINQQETPRNLLFCKSPASNSSRRQVPQDRVQSHSCSEKSTPSAVIGNQKKSSKMSGQTQGIAADGPNLPLEQAEQGSENSEFEGRHVLSTSVSSQLGAEPCSEQNLVTVNTEEIILINSSSDDEEEEGLNHSGMELSDSDPMEECYRIFMEANNEEKGTEETPGAHLGAVDAEKMEVNVTPKGLPGRKRVAHEAKQTEQPVAKSRPQPQVLVPLCEPVTSGFGSRPSVSSKTQQVQQRASTPTASVKGGQAFVSSTSQKKPETQFTPSVLTQNPATLQPVRNAFVNYIPLGPAVIEVGNNLHLILPDGAFPVPISSNSNPVTPVLTPINQVHTRALAIKQTYHPHAVTPMHPMQRCRLAAPVLIPAVARKPLLNSTFTSASLRSTSTISTVPQNSGQASAKPLPAKRKLKQQCEAAKDKVPHDVRQRYVNMFTEEFLKTTPNVNDAFEKALAEEKTVYNRSVNKLKYMSVAVNALKRLKSQSTVAAKDENKVYSQKRKGNIPLNPTKFKGNSDDMALYESLKDYILTDEKLIESNYPVQHPEKRGSAVLFTEKKVNPDALKRICCRCGATYSVSQSGKHIRKEECNYHYGKGVENRVPGGVETRYSCCQGVMGAPGCQVFKLHVHDALSLDGFVSTSSRGPSDRSCPGVYSLDCEMCYTVHGLELSRVTVVNSSLEVVYDTFVKPENEVIDYNTRFSGVSEEDVKGHHASLRDVQETLLSFINADTILVGHCLETDLCLLKLLHGMVVDTSVVFPHRLGPPHKLTLNKLTAEYLRRIIQESVCGHDTAEDATACMELMLWKVKEDGKLKK
ncbi:RNA exonuclease 1 homolog isoform X1 [Simochromis diagramma]|uniref:RNA exonuclease 1 homolog isoform X1 n=1 Tax=Simochromis diagramma TaxID=43689 RepID=UPI001A7ECFB1|nr:RNA exonuclease 1 homolog isoform X1 [Simochromis diagramma]